MKTDVNNATEAEPKAYTGKVAVAGISSPGPALDPPMPRYAVLRVMMLGFSLTVLLVLVAAYFGYQGSRSIQDNAQGLVREHLVNTERAAALEARIEADSEDLLRELAWVLGTCLVVAAGGAVLERGQVEVLDARVVGVLGLGDADADATTGALVVGTPVDGPLQRREKRVIHLQSVVAQTISRGFFRQAAG